MYNIINNTIIMNNNIQQEVRLLSGGSTKGGAGRIGKGSIKGDIEGELEE